MEIPKLGLIKPSIEDELEKLNNSYAVVRWNSQTLIMNDAFDVDGRRALTFMNKDGFFLWNENNIFWEETDNPNKPKKIKVARAWMESPLRRQFLNVVFEPNRKPDPSTYNLWSGYSFDPKPDAGKFDVFMDHIRVNVCGENDQHFKWIVGWMADIIQRPERKLGTALVLRGKMGVGKGVVFNHLGALIKKHYLSVQQTSQVTGRFNSHLADTLLLFLDEAFWGGNKEAEGVLKALVTEHNIPIEMKGRDIYQLKSYLRIGISTNNDWAVPTGLEDERRFAVFDVGDGCQQNKPYFMAMDKQLREGGYEALLHYLINYQYDPIEIGRIPRTEALLDQKLLSMPHEMKWWFNCLNDGKIGITKGGGWEVEIIRDDFYESYGVFCKQMNVRHPVVKNGLKKALNKRKIRFRQDKDRQAFDGWYYQILSLEECRKSFEEVIGHTIDWEKQ